jgi:hypothetical protein
MMVGRVSPLRAVGRCERRRLASGAQRTDAPYPRWTDGRFMENLHARARLQKARELRKD